LFSADCVPNAVEPNTLDGLDPLLLKGLVAPNPEAAAPFEAPPPNAVDVEEATGPLKPNSDGSAAALDVTDPSAVGLSTLVPPLGVKGVNETIGLLDAKGLLEAALEVAPGAAALFIAELFVDEVLAEPPNPKLNLGWFNVLPAAALELA